MRRALFLLLAFWLAACTGAESRRYELDLRFGGHGDAAGKFNDPTGVAVTASEVFVSDARNGRIQVFSHDGRFLRMFGERQLQRPMNLSISGGELFVPDFFADAVFVFGLDGRLHDTVHAQDGFNSPGGVAVRPDGSLLVADTYAQRIVELDRKGTVRRVWGSPGPPGFLGGRFNYPTDVAALPDGGFLVADGYNDRIEQFDATGRLLRKWGGPFAMNISGPFAGWFATVTSIAVSADGAIFGADFHNGRVQIFDPEGRFLGRFGLEPVTGQGPMAVAVAPEGSVFVVDLGRQEVQRWRRR